jgi:hypothetical protein
LVVPKATLPLLNTPSPRKGMSGSRFGNALLQTVIYPKNG